MNTYLIHLSQNPAEGQKEAFVIIEARTEEAARSEALEYTPDGYGIYAVFTLDKVSGSEALPTGRVLYPRY